MVAIRGGMNVAKVLKAAQPAYETHENPRPAFMDEMSAYGFEDRVGRKLPPVPVIGKVIRCASPTDKQGKQSGWYYYNEISDDFKPGALIGIGVFGSWQGNPEKVVWTSKRKDSMSPAEQARLDEQMRAAKIARELELAESRKIAASKAQTIWAESDPAPEGHPYLVKKGIKPHGTRVSQGKIVIPVKEAGMIVSLQFVDVEGGKKFFPGGKVKGCYCLIGELTETVYVAEGFATAATIFEATGDACYVAFNANNLSDVVGVAKDANPDSIVVIAGDDDHRTVGNPGRNKATAAGDVYRSKVIFPAVEGSDTDFNDMMMRAGIKAVRELLDSKPKVYERIKSQDTLPEYLLTPPGILAEIVGYYNGTARAQQPGFAVQTALAILSLVLSRVFKTDRENYTSLYFLNVARSGTGKEHAKTVMENVLESAGIDDLIAGGGYTSAGAVLSTLLRQPRHCTIIDEFGKYLEAASGTNNTNQQEANTKLMEVIGRLHGIVKPNSYSTMTLTKEKAQEFTDRKCLLPAITLLCMTTPSSLYKTLDNDSIADGFLGRFIIQQSYAVRDVTDDRPMQDVPHRITKWIEDILKRSGQDTGVQQIASEKPSVINIPISNDALKLSVEFAKYIVVVSNDLEPLGMDALPGRSKEMAMRMSLIVALSENPQASSVEARHMEWSVAYVKFCLDQSIKEFRMQISGSPHERDKKEVLQALRNAGAKGVSQKEMLKTPPFSRHRPRDLKEIVSALDGAGLVALEVIKKAGPGRPREAYVALD